MAAVYAEIVAAALKSYCPLQAFQLAKGMTEAVSAAAALGSGGRPTDGVCGLGNLSVSGFRLGPEASHHLPFLACREALSLPEESGPAVLLDLLCEPLKVFARLRIGGERPERLMQQGGADAAETPPRRKPQAAGLARKAVGEQKPLQLGRRHRRTVTTVTSVFKPPPDTRPRRASSPRWGCRSQTTGSSACRHYLSNRHRTASGRSAVASSTAFDSSLTGSFRLGSGASIVGRRASTCRQSIGQSIFGGARRSAPRRERPVSQDGPRRCPIGPSPATLNQWEAACPNSNPTTCDTAHCS